MAKINPIKLKQDADKEEKAGRFDKAIDCLKQIVADNPKDWNTINKIGDLYAKLNNVKAANEQYAKVAEFYSKDGFYLKAIAVWKKINKNDPTVLEPYLNLADLYAKQGLMVDAKAQYKQVVDEYIKRGRVREAGDALKKLADIDPTDLTVRSKLAELYMRDGNSAKAVEEHIAIADELGKKGHLCRGPPGPREGPEARPEERAAPLRAGADPPPPEELREGGAGPRRGDTQAPGRPRGLAAPGRGLRGGQAAERTRETILLPPDPPTGSERPGRPHPDGPGLPAAEAVRRRLRPVPTHRRQADREEGQRSRRGDPAADHPAQRRAHQEPHQAGRDLPGEFRKDALVAQTYSQIVEAYIQQGQNDQAASVLEILVGLEPHNDQHQSKLEFVRRRQGGRPRRPAPRHVPRLTPPPPRSRKTSSWPPTIRLA